MDYFSQNNDEMKEARLNARQGNAVATCSVVFTLLDPKFGSAAQLSCIELHTDKTNGRGTRKMLPQPDKARTVLRARSLRGQGYKLTADAVFQMQCPDLESHGLKTAPP